MLLCIVQKGLYLSTRYCYWNNEWRGFSKTHTLLSNNSNYYNFTNA